MVRLGSLFSPGLHGFRVAGQGLPLASERPPPALVLRLEARGHG